MKAKNTGFSWIMISFVFDLCKNKDLPSSCHGESDMKYVNIEIISSSALLMSSSFAKTS